MEHVSDHEVASGPVRAGDRRRFRSTLYGLDGEGILVRKYSDQPVTVLRPADNADEYLEPMWRVRAEDGTEFSAWERELVRGGSNVYVLPDGTYVDNPEWKEGE